MAIGKGLEHEHHGSCNSQHLASTVSLSRVQLAARPMHAGVVIRALISVSFGWDLIQAHRAVEKMSNLLLIWVGGGVLLYVLW